MKPSTLLWIYWGFYRIKQNVFGISLFKNFWNTVSIFSRQTLFFGELYTKFLCIQVMQHVFARCQYDCCLNKFRLIFRLICIVAKLSSITCTFCLHNYSLDWSFVLHQVMQLIVPLYDLVLTRWLGSTHSLELYCFHPVMNLTRSVVFVGEEEGSFMLSLTYFIKLFIIMKQLIISLINLTLRYSDDKYYSFKRKYD